MFEYEFITDLRNYKSFDEKMEYLKLVVNKNDIKNHSEFIIRSFDGISNFKQALEFSKFFKERLGNIMVSRKSSSKTKHFQTVIDDTSSFNYKQGMSKDENIQRSLLNKAFTTLGFRAAKQCSFDELFDDYTNHCCYREKVMWIMNKYPEKKIQMIKDFFEGLYMNKSISKRLQFIKNTKCSLRILPRPEMIIDCFSDIDTQKRAIKVARVIRNRIRYSSIICREASRSWGELMTLVDVIGSVDYTWKEKPSRQLFINAFKQIGMKSASDTNSEWLKKRYIACNDYTKLIVTNYGEYRQPLGLMEFNTNDDDIELYDDLYEKVESSTTINEIIHHLKTSECDFNKMDSPFIYYDTYNSPIDDEDSEFYYEYTIEYAMKIAQIFKDRLGVIAICRSNSFETGRYMTMLDVVDDQITELDEKLYTFRYALEHLGFKRAEDCSPLVLRQLQSYSNDYNYIEMKNSNQELKEELMIELYKPERIKKWIDSGCNLEDYLC